MIFWFSGTGNSKYAAQRMAEALNEPLLCMNDRIKAHDTAAVETGERLVIVTPTYAWRIPRLVRDWLLQTELRGARQAWFVMTCGSEIGSADRYNRELCRAKGLSCMGTAQIVMPENYIAMFGVPQAGSGKVEVTLLDILKLLLSKSYWLLLAGVLAGACVFLVTTFLITPIAASKTVRGEALSVGISGWSTISTPPAFVMRTISVGATLAKAPATRQAKAGSVEVMTTSSSWVSVITDTETMPLRLLRDSDTSGPSSCSTASRIELLARILE